MVVTKDIDTGEVNVWKAADSLVEYLKDVTLIVAHNGIGFDFSILNRLWNTKIRLNQVYDTLIASRLLDPSVENGHSLDAWGNRMGTVKKVDYKRIWEWLMERREEYKGECFNIPHMALLEYYCIRDVEVTANLYKHLTDELTKKEFSQESLALEHKVAAIIEEQTRHGFKLDQVYATCLLADIKGKMAGIYEQMQERWPPVVTPRFHKTSGKPIKDCVDTFNPGSRKQIGEKLMELGWKPKVFTEKGQAIVDESVLAKVALPEAECRECWTVEAGNVLVGCDASGLELRMLAHYMKDEEYVKTVTEGSSKEGTDVHTQNQKAAGLQTRDQAKTFIYAFLYGAGPAKIGSIVGGNAKAGQKLIDSFLANTPALQRLRNTVSRYASKGFVPGLDGRKIWVRSEHAALNSLLQGAGAIVMKKALVLFYDKTKANKWPVKLVANVHDEFQLEVPKIYATIVGEAAKQSIVEAGLHFKLRCPLDGEYKIGNNWRETH